MSEQEETKEEEADVEEGGGNPQQRVVSAFKGGKPYGASIVSTLLASAAFVCSVTANFSCYYVSVTEKDANNVVTAAYARGIWYGQVDSSDECGGYPSETSIDTKWRSARAFSVIVTIFGGGAMLMVLCLYGAPPKHIRKTMISIGNTCMWCCLFQGLTLLFQNSNACDGVTCELADGGNLTITAIILWITAACCMGPTPTEVEVLTEEHREEMERLKKEMEDNRK